MENQNITLSLPKEILQKVKIIAVQRQISVSGLLTHALESIVKQEDAYGHAQRRHLQWLDQSIDLGTSGDLFTNRANLHERH